MRPHPPYISRQKFERKRVGARDRDSMNERRNAEADDAAMSFPNFRIAKKRVKTGVFGIPPSIVESVSCEEL
jgi:hypothetical protein